MELPGEERASTEIASLWEYLGGRLRREFRTMLVGAPAPAVPKPVFGRAGLEQQVAS
jgi:hypothetical protein